MRTQLSLLCAAFPLVAWAAPPTKEKHANYTETAKLTFDGKVEKATFEMISISGGEFQMGSPAAEFGRRKDEGPQVKVRLKPFWIGKHEVTWEEYDLFRRSLAEAMLARAKDKTPRKALAQHEADAITGPSTKFVGHESERYPASAVTHYAAMRYCEWLSKRTGKPYRLPTEAEWEYACRAGSKTAYAMPAGSMLEDYAWFKANSATEERHHGSTHPVGTRQANVWGLHDMCGNVMEWCLDHYVPDAFDRFAKLPIVAGAIARPCFPPTDCRWSHVARGGHWRSEWRDLRSAARIGSERSWVRGDPFDPPALWWFYGHDNIGLRVCRSFDEDELNGLSPKVQRGNDEVFTPR